MKIIDKIKAKNSDNYNAGPVTIAFLGDNVTHGCFDCYFDGNGVVNTYFNRSASYANRVAEILNILYPSAQINIVNSGISGDGARNGNAGFDRDIKPFSPDLVVVSYGLNDSCAVIDAVNTYVDNLNSIFSKVKELGAECIFLTENMMCTKVSCHLQGDNAKDLAKFFAEVQNSGTLDRYFDAAKRAAADNGVKVCDIYSYWKMMYDNGVDVTDLLANKYNHPIEKLHYFTAVKLVETMFS